MEVKSETLESWISGGKAAQPVSKGKGKAACKKGRPASKVPPPCNAEPPKKKTRQSVTDMLGGKCCSPPPAPPKAAATDAAPCPKTAPAPAPATPPTLPKPPAKASTASSAQPLVLCSPPPVAVVPSAKTKAIALTAGEDLCAASGETRRALWMRYLRTRQQDGRGETKRAPKAGAYEKMPREMSAKVSGNMNFYFELWLKCGCSWGAVVAHEKRQSEVVHDEDVGYEWLYGFQLKETVPKEIAEGWMGAMKCVPELYKPDPFMPDNEDAAMYKILRRHLEGFKKTDKRSQSVELTANVADSGDIGKKAAAELMSEGGALQSIQGVDTTPTKTPEELAAEEAERQKVKEEREAERSKPETKCRRWLANLPKDVELIKKALADIEADKTLPQEKSTALQQEFKTHLSTLTQLRTTLEDALAKKSINMPDLKTAAAEVISMRQSYKSMKEQMKIYAVK